MADTSCATRRGTTRRVSLSSGEEQADDQSANPSISGNGRYVVFTSGASNLVRGDTNGVPAVFVRDLRRGRAIRCCGLSARVSPRLRGSSVGP